MVLAITERKEARKCLLAHGIVLLRKSRINIYCGYDMVNEASEARTAGKTGCRDHGTLEIAVEW